MGMAATRLIALHVNKGKTVAQCLADRSILPGLALLSGLRAHLPAPATSEAAPQGFQGPGSQAPILPVPPADGHCEDQA